MAAVWLVRGLLRTGPLHIHRALLALGIERHFKGQRLIEHRPATAPVFGDVDKDVLPALARADEAKTLVVVPAFEGAFEAHR